MSFTPLTGLSALDAPTLNGVLTEIDESRRRMQFGGLVGLEVNSTSNYAMSIAPGVARDDTDTVDLVRTTAQGSITVNGFSGTGAGKLDTGSIANNTWYYVFLIADGNGNTSGLVSASPSAPTMPVGYLYKRRVGMMRTNTTPRLYRFETLTSGLQRELLFMETTSSGDFLVLNGVDVSNASWDTVNLSAVVPPTARLARVQIFSANNTSNIYLSYRISSNMISRLLFQGAVSERYPLNIYLPLTSSQTVDIQASGAATETLSLHVQGYIDDLTPSVIV